jgi:O-antigen/teichoic acid export membrane protein
MADRFLSLPYLFLRSSTAGGALLFGLIQTFVFARVLSPERFSVFILIGTLGITLWLVDFGLTRILFVRQREAFLAGRKDPVIAGQSMAVLIAYATAVLAGTLVCTAFMALRGGTPFLHAIEFGLFFLFTSLNLVWFVVRFVSIATDQFVFFESHEATRRVGHIALMLAMLIGLPFMAFLILANLLWAAMFASALKRLFAHGVMAFPQDGIVNNIRTFFRGNRREAFRSASFAAGEFYIYNLPYLVVPLAYGLGAPTIILDTTFKIFRGSTIVYAAGCDVAVPKQTRALAAGDRQGLIRATLMAAALCCLPALTVGALLYFASGWFFAFLLGPAATMPAALTPVLIVLLVANLAQTVSNSLLLHTGFFRQLAFIAAGTALAMTVMTSVAVLMRLDITGYMAGYAAVFVVSVLFSITMMIRGPIAAAGTEPLRYEENGRNGGI